MRGWITQRHLQMKLQSAFLVDTLTWYFGLRKTGSTGKTLLHVEERPSNDFFSIR